MIKSGIAKVWKRAGVASWGRPCAHQHQAVTATICDDSSPNEDHTGQAIMGTSATHKKWG